MAIFRALKDKLQTFFFIFDRVCVLSIFGFFIYFDKMGYEIEES